MKLGILGGTFDPPHFGHLQLAILASRQLGLDRVLWVLTGQSPFKRDRELTNPEIRWKMLECALTNHEEFIRSRLEIQRPGPHYTVETLKELRKQYPSEDRVYLIGGDALQDFPRWKDPDEILKCCRLAAWQRPGSLVDMDKLERELPGISAKLGWLDAPPNEISGTDIRERVRQGLPLQSLLHKSVEQLIREHGLYRD